MGTFSSIFILIMGVLLPYFTLGFEYVTAMSGSEYFDPIPTAWHALLVAFVPTANLIVFICCRRCSKAPHRSCGYLSATGFLIAALYSLPYLPIMPIAVPAILFYGIGLLPLSPANAAASALILRRALKKRGLVTESGRVPGWKSAFATVFACVVLLEARPAITNIAVTMASSSNSARASRGINILRSVGDEDLLLRSSYGTMGRMIDPFSMLFRFSEFSRPDHEQLQEIFFRVTGKSHNQLPPPESPRGRGNWFDWTSDEHVGTRIIGQQIEGLELSSSSIGGSIDAAAALGYTEWTMTFRNATLLQQEARTHLALPPGSVVSRLTLWIGGEEREATFAARGQTQEAYQQVVSAKRDPVLLTTDGPGRALLQLFPVPAHGGTMKVRIGITTPLKFSSERKPSFILPSFRDRNFQIKAQLGHDVWIESSTAFSSTTPHLRNERRGQDTYAIRGSLRTEELLTTELDFPALSAESSSFTSDLATPGENVIVQRIESLPVQTKQSLIAVIDASAPLRGHHDRIIEVLESLRGKLNLRLLLASDSVSPFPVAEPQLIPADSKSFSEEVRNALESIPFRGGQDTVPALIRGLDLAAGNERTAILWFHGPQPLSSMHQETLVQRFTRFPGGPTIYDIELETGENAILQSLERLGAEIIPAPAQTEALKRLLSGLTSESKAVFLSRAKIPLPSFDSTKFHHRTSSHLARLWAADEVQRAIQKRDSTSISQATLISALYGIVTPLTGAVVLETQQQYEAAGLARPGPLELARVPTIPEPETYLLMAIASVMMFAAYRKAGCQKQSQ